MSYAALEKKLRMVSEQDFEFVAHFLDLVLENSKNRTEAEQNAEYLSMLDKSFTQLKNGENYKLPCFMTRKAFPRCFCSMPQW